MINRRCSCWSCAMPSIMARSTAFNNHAQIRQIIMYYHQLRNPMNYLQLHNCHYSTAKIKSHTKMLAARLSRYNVIKCCKISRCLQVRKFYSTRCQHSTTFDLYGAPHFNCSDNRRFTCASTLKLTFRNRQHKCYSLASIA